MSCYVCQNLDPVPPTDPESHTRLIAWGEAGGRQEARQKRGFVGDSGKLLRKALKAGGFQVWSAWQNDKIQQEDVAFRNVIPGTPPGNKFPGFTEARACLRSCQHEFITKDTHPWIAFGANAVEALTGFRFPQFLKVRGSFLPCLDRPDFLVASIHPAFLVRGGGDDNPDGQAGKSQEELYPLLALDARRATSVAAPTIPLVRLVSLSEVKAAWRKNPDPLVALDLEGGNPPNLTGLCWRPGESWVMQWESGIIPWLEELAHDAMLVVHNGNYDFPELQEMGMRLPETWVDTINTAALVNPSVPLALQAQVLSYVPGTVAWKGLINHQHGYDYEDNTVRLYRRLWTEVLTRMGKPVPKTGFEWYVFYNGLDTDGTRRLAPAHRAELTAQGRMQGYREVLQPLQRPLLEMGQRGLPVDLGRMAFHRKACERLERMAQGILDRASKTRRFWRVQTLSVEVAALELERKEEKEEWPEIAMTEVMIAQAEKRGPKLSRAFSKADELSKLRTKLRAAKEAEEKGFNLGSTPQKVDLLYEWLGLPPVKHRKTGSLTTDEKAIEQLISRLKRGTIKPAKGTVEEALRVCKAIGAGQKWPGWRRNFLTLKGDDHAD